ncbi:MAG: hypothetical protein NC413_14910 [Muribaculum sp.]|nr:hypothetical protein [Muribaculum sp.]
MVNGFSGIFMVASVEAVSAVRQTKRDNRRSSGQELRGKNAEGLFASILEDHAEDEEEKTVACRTSVLYR